MLKKYQLLRDSTVVPEAQMGTIVYQSASHDYGLASDDTRLTGIKHISVSMKEDGSYPCFTIPLRDLREVV